MHKKKSPEECVAKKHNFTQIASLVSNKLLITSSFSVIVIVQRRFMELPVVDRY